MDGVEIMKEVTITLSKIFDIQQKALQSYYYRIALPYNEQMAASYDNPELCSTELCEGIILKVKRDMVCYYDLFPKLDIEVVDVKKYKQKVREVLNHWFKDNFGADSFDKLCKELGL
jgi:hypothetical protein